VKKILYILPFILIPIIMPVYFFLDEKIFVDIFGCGCVTPGFKKNSLGNYFNANDLRKIVFSVLAVIIIAFGVLISTKFKRRFSIVIYNICVILLNVALAYSIISLGGWK